MKQLIKTYHLILTSLSTFYFRIRPFFSSIYNFITFRKLSIERIALDRHFCAVGEEVVLSWKARGCNGVKIEGKRYGSSGSEKITVTSDIIIIQFTGNNKVIKQAVKLNKQKISIKKELNAVIKRSFLQKTLKTKQINYNRRNSTFSRSLNATKVQINPAKIKHPLFNQNESL